MNEEIRAELARQIQDVQERFNELWVDDLDEPTQEIARDLFLKLNLDNVAAWLYNVMPQWEVRIELGVGDDRTIGYNVHFRRKPLGAA